MVRSRPLSCCPEIPKGELFLASETDRLRACLVHTPGREIERLVPANYRFHLYDDLLHGGRARHEHQALRALLERLGTQVHEFSDLLAQVYDHMSSSDRKRFLRRVHAASPGAPQYVLRALAREPNPAIVARALIEGIEATESFAAEVQDALFHIQPMANLLFMQDSAVVLLDRVVQGYMSQLVRMPEEIVVETVIRQSAVFGPCNTGQFWLDPGFRRRHRMQRMASDYLQFDAARAELRLGAVDAMGPTTLPSTIGIDRLHLELSHAFSSQGRHFVLEGGNVLTLRRDDGRVVVLLSHNARTSADAIDELAYRLLRREREDGEPRVGAVLVVDMADAGEEGRHLDTHVLATAPGILWADRGLVQAPSGLSARFFVFLPDREPASEARDPEDGYRVRPKVKLRSCASFEDALTLSGLGVHLHWIPDRVPWEAESPEEASSTAEWLSLRQSLWTGALNVLVVAPSIFIGLDRHATFYRETLEAVCIDAESTILTGELSSLRCCALLEALRERGHGQPVAVLIRGDELSRARGGARSLVMPLVRKPDEPS